MPNHGSAFSFKTPLKEVLEEGGLVIAGDPLIREIQRHRLLLLPGSAWLLALLRHRGQVIYVWHV